MARYSSSKAEKSWVNGLWNAEAKGRAAASDPAFTERHCPYTRYEHKRSWLEGFREVRNGEKSDG
jgi:ribosome modulation factor